MSLPPLNESRREEKWRSHKTLKRDSIDKELEDIAAELAKGRIKLGEQNKERRRKMDEKLTKREKSAADDLLVDSDQTLEHDSVDKELEDIAAELAKGRIKLGEQNKNKECRKKMDEKLTTRENSPSDDLLVDSDKEEEVYDRN